MSKQNRMPIKPDARASLVKHYRGNFVQDVEQELNERAVLIAKTWGDLALSRLSAIDILTSVIHLVELWQAETSNPANFRALLKKYQYKESLWTAIGDMRNSLSQSVNSFGQQVMDGTIDFQRSKMMLPIVVEFHDAVRELLDESQLDNGLALLTVIGKYEPDVLQELAHLRDRNKRNRGASAKTMDIVRRVSELITDDPIAGRKGISLAAAYRQVGQEYKLKAITIEGYWKNYGGDLS